MYHLSNKNKKKTLKKGTKKKTPRRKIDKSKIRKTLKHKKINKNKIRSTLKVKKIQSNKIEIKKNIRKSIKHNTLKTSMKYNDKFVNILEKLESLMMKKGEHFRARAYTKAKEAIILYKSPITKVEQLKEQKGIGKTILNKLQEYVETGTLNVLEKAKNNPIFIFTDVYGIGPKKAVELVKKYNISTISELRERQEEVLNDVQKKGLKHYEDVLKRIPRKEIDVYEKELKKIFDTVKNKGSTFEIMGSYRRGSKDSGDIDICISDPKNDSNVFVKFIDALIEKKILIEVLSRGKTKSLGISKLRRKPARRIDFMFTKSEELAFALLYFTGSKSFNTVMRKRALDLGYSMNEHGLYKMTDGKKGAKLEKHFPTEKSVFDFLGMVYKGPTERKDGNSVIIIQEDKPIKTFWQENYEDKTKSKKKIDKSKIRKKALKKKNSSVEIREGKRLIKEFLKFGQAQLEESNEEQLSAMIRAANNGYYCNNKSLMSDEEYDILKEFIEETFPDNKAIQEGHTMCSVVVEKKKMKLPFEMWSMDKFKTEDKIKLWLKSYKGPYIISAKVDGVSAGYSTMGDKPTLFTRGNGKVGQDISHAIEYLGLPTDKGIEIRGELLMKKTTFENNWSEQFANVRNMIAGTCNAKESLPDRWNDIDFVCYEIVTPHLKPSEQFKLIKKLNIISVIHKKMKKINKSELSKYLMDWRENYDYDIDGIIVADDRKYPRTSKNPKHAFAFKTVLDDQIVESKVVNVIWSPSKDGYLKPKVQIQPVKLGGAVIQFATLHNAEFVIKNKIGLGAIVQIIRSGDVIPKVEKVVKPAKKIKMPTFDHGEYKWNSTKKDLVLLNASDNDIVKMKMFDDFFNKLDVVGLGRGNIQRIIDSGFNTIPKILTMTIDDFMQVEGFKEKLSTKIHNSIHERLENVELAELMSASNIFGRGLGTKRIVAIMEEYPNILTSKENDKAKLNKIIELEGFKEKTALLFVPHIQKFISFLKDINQMDKLKKIKNKKVDKSHPLYNKKIVITGFRDKELQQKLDNIGVKLGTSVSKNTFLVLVKDLDDDTGKADKARKLGVKLQTPEWIKAKYSI